MVGLESAVGLRDSAVVVIAGGSEVAVGVISAFEVAAPDQVAYPSMLGRGVRSEMPRPDDDTALLFSFRVGMAMVRPSIGTGLDITSPACRSLVPAGGMLVPSVSNFVSKLSPRASRLSLCAPRPSSATFRRDPRRRRVFCCCDVCNIWGCCMMRGCGGASAGMVMKEGVGGSVGTDGSFSMVLRRARGRCSPAGRMKGSLENNPAALEELRLRAGAGG